MSIHVHQRLEDLEAALNVLARHEFGESAGHPFRGNQYTDGTNEGIEGKDFLPAVKNLPGANTQIEREMRSILDRVAQGEKVIVNKPKVATLVQEMKEKVDEIKAVRAVQKAAGVPDDKLQKIPDMNLCSVSVPGTNYFCADNLGVPRVKMPQLSLSADKIPDGAPAKNFPVNQFGEINIAEHFAGYLESQGVKITDTSARSGDLRSTQSELQGDKIARNMGLIESGKMDRSIFVSSDNYVLDGHHQWAAQLAVDNITGSVADHNVRVRQIDMPMRELLPLTLGYTAGMGVPGADWKDTVRGSVEEFGDVVGHDFHGNQWTGGQGGDKQVISPTTSALRMKYFPRGDDSQSVERGKGDNVLRLDKAYDGLRTGASPIGLEGVQQLRKGDRVAAVVNGAAWPADVLAPYSSSSNVLSVRYYPDRKLPPVEVERDGAPVKEPISVVGIASVSVSDVYRPEDITTPFPTPIKMPHSGGNMQTRWGTIAASAGPPKEYIMFNDGSVLEFTTCESCGGQTADGSKTCPNCGGSTTAASAEGTTELSLSERVDQLEAAIADLARMEFGKMPPQFAANAKKKKDAAAKSDGKKSDSKPPWLKKKVESAADDGEEFVGDVPGHAFHGNQYTGGEGGGGDKQSAQDQASARQRERENTLATRGAGVIPKDADGKVDTARLKEELKGAPADHIARVIKADWGSKVNFGAKPYLDAMSSMSSFKEPYGQDSGQSIGAYFLSNATSWRGDVARVTKAEIKDQIK